MRRLLFPTAIAVALLAIAYSGYWFVLARIVVADLADWSAARRAEGYTVAYGEPKVGGFPLAVAARLSAPTVAAPGGAWRWQGPDATLEVRPWAPFDLLFSAPGHHRLAIAGAKPREIAIESPSVRLAVTVARDGSANGFRLAIADAAVTEDSLGGASVATASVEARFAVPPPADPSHSSLDLTIEASGLDLPASVEAPLGRHVDHVHVALQLMGPLPPGSPRQAISGWRDAGGEVEIRKGELDWGPLGLAGDGTVALDRAMQPLAAGTVRVAGLGETLDTLVAAGLLEPSPAKLAKFMFTALAKPTAAGGRPEVQLPLTIQDGYLYTGPIRLAALRPLDWSWLP
ncbi:MAG: hypothetical protein QOK29_2226 [Rhodospirillaceae bacterium]|nr:hypothetical protein [Rhodospirillaceae bacterium]